MLPAGLSLSVARPQGVRPWRLEPFGFHHLEQSPLVPPTHGVATSGHRQRRASGGVEIDERFLSGNDVRVGSSHDQHRSVRGRPTFLAGSAPYGKSHPRVLFPILMLHHHPLGDAVPSVRRDNKRLSNPDTQWLLQLFSSTFPLSVFMVSTFALVTWLVGVDRWVSLGCASLFPF